MMQPEDDVKGSPTGALQPARESVRDDQKIMLVLAYLGLFALIPLLTVKDSDFVHWHARQGTTLFVVTLVSSLILGVVPVLGWCIAALGVAGALLMALMGMIKALNGERWRIPLVGDLAERF